MRADTGGERYLRVGTELIDDGFVEERPRAANVRLAGLALTTEGRKLDRRNFRKPINSSEAQLMTKLPRQPTGDHPLGSERRANPVDVVDGGEHMDRVLLVTVTKVETQAVLDLFSKASGTTDTCINN